MNKVEEFYKRVICIAGEVCGVDPVDMMSFNREECVNARGILIIILLDKGVLGESCGRSYRAYQTGC